MSHNLFVVNENNKMEPFTGTWLSLPKELELETYIISTTNEGSSVLNEALFGEDLLFIDRQVIPDRTNRRVDILAIDKMGNGVIIELKRDKAPLGVETQALQYLALLSNLKGRNFVERVSKGDKELEEKIESFVVGTPAEEINKNSRIILLARGFDAALYSLGNWLFSKGVAFRCITYQPVQVEEKRFLSFSVAFDRSPDSLFPLGFSSATRASRTSGYFWHNIGVKEQKWWNILQDKGQISAGFDAAPGDRGEAILRSYIKGDTIFAYASGGYGAVGYGIIKNPESYRLLTPSDDPKDMNNWQLHRLEIQWVALAHDLRGGIPYREVKANFGIPYPVGTYAQIKDPAKAKELKNEMDRRDGFEKLELQR